MREVARYIVVFVFFAAIFCFFAVKKGGFFYTTSRSMEPTIEPGDRMVLMKAGVLKKGDIIIFKSPENPQDYLVKRLVGLPGDVVAVAGGRLYLNGQLQEEPYVKDQIMVYHYGPVLVPSGKLFVLGDNRNNSDDSTVWGFLPAENVRGRVIFRYWPPNRLGRIK